MTSLTNRKWTLVQNRLAFIYVVLIMNYADVAVHYGHLSHNMQVMNVVEDVKLLLIATYDKDLLHFTFLLILKTDITKY